MKRNVLSRIIATPIRSIKDNMDDLIIIFLLSITIAQVGKYINIVADHTILGFLYAAGIDFGIYRTAQYLRIFNRTKERIIAITCLLFMLFSSFIMNYFYLDKSFIISKASYLTTIEKMAFAATIPVLIGMLSYFNSMVRSFKREQKRNKTKKVTKYRTRRLAKPESEIAKLTKNPQTEIVKQIVNPSPFSGITEKRIR